MEGGRAQLACAAAILVALGATLALAGPDPAAPKPAAAADLTPAEIERVSVGALPEVARNVERVRELEFRELPEPEVVTAAHLNRLGARQVERQRDDLGIAADNAFGAITGLLEDGDDVGAITDSTGDLAAAAYDPRSDRLYVMSDAVGGSPALVQFVLAHELDHALEDQVFGLPEGGRLTDDEALASQALVEGSATAVMSEYAIRYLDPFDLIAAAGTIDEGTGDVPEAVVDQLTWTYLGGQEFVTGLIELAGSWKLVDYAIADRPPASTEQVLHPRKYVLDERPRPVAITARPLRAAGWRRADRNTLGEFATTQLLELGVDRAEATMAAAGWDGDRYELWRRDIAPAECAYPCRSDLALVARWALESDRDAAELAGALAGYIAEGLAGSAAGTRIWAVDGGHVAIAVSGREVGLAFAPERRLARITAAAQAGS